MRNVAQNVRGDRREEMTAIEYLRQYRDADRLVRRLRYEYEKEFELIDTIKSTSDIDDLPRSKRVSKLVEDKAIKLADKAMELKIAELQALHVRQEVFETVLSIGGDESDVLIERYINLRTWTDLCVAVHWSWYKVHELHQTGLKKIAEKIK